MGLVSCTRGARCAHNHSSSRHGAARLGWELATMNMQAGARLFLPSLLLCALLARATVAQSVGPPIRPIPPLPDLPSEGCPRVTGEGLICFVSTDCRGGIALRPDGDGGLAAVSSAADCCGGLGLSFCDERGCDNCFSKCNLYACGGCS